VFVISNVKVRFILHTAGLGSVKMLNPNLICHLASEDRFDQSQQFNSSNFKRRAVSPSVSLTGSPVLSGIGSPPPTHLMMYGSSPTSNAAARAQQKPGQFPTNVFNLHEASGGLSKMSLSEE
jgi:hypothetical protein